MKYEITVSPEVAAVGDGTRRRTVTVGKKSKQMVFTSRPTLLAELPQEVAADPHLRVREVGTRPPAAAEPPDLDKAKLADLQAYAEKLGVDSDGTKAEIRERIDTELERLGEQG